MKAFLKKYLNSVICGIVIAFIVAIPFLFKSNESVMIPFSNSWNFNVKNYVIGSTYEYEINKYSSAGSYSMWVKTRFGKVVEQCFMGTYGTNVRSYWNAEDTGSSIDANRNQNRRKYAVSNGNGYMLLYPDGETQDHRSGMKGAIGFYNNKQLVNKEIDGTNTEVYCCDYYVYSFDVERKFSVKLFSNLNNLKKTSEYCGELLISKDEDWIMLDGIKYYLEKN